MADVYTRIGYIKGATGATGAQGEKGDTGEAATIQVGSVTTVPYGQTANVVNSGTEQAAVFDFTIPQGRPGQQVTEMDNLLLNSITTSAAEFPLPAVGETGKVLWGKVVKWFSDMASLVATKLNAANVANNLTTTASGYALDARQGKALNDAMTPEQLTASYAVNVAETNGLHAYKVGKIAIVCGYFNPTSNIAANNTIANISNFSALQEGYVTAMSSSSKTVRFALRTNGRIQCETEVTANQYYSFTFVVALA